LVTLQKSRRHLKSQGTWEQNYERCCSLGLSPIIIERIEELNCLSNFTKSTNIFKYFNPLSNNVSLLDKWAYNFNYWTGGTQKGCKGQWAWCSGSGNVPFPENLTWTFNQPDNKGGGDDCIHMRLNQNDTGVAISDRNCSDKFIIACEVQIHFLLQEIRFISLKGAPKLQTCSKPKCPNASACERNVYYMISLFF